MLSASSNKTFPSFLIIINDLPSGPFDGGHSALTGPEARVVLSGESCTVGYRCHYTKSNPIDDHSNISSKKLQKQNFKPLGHYTCMQCGTSHLQKVQENILSRIILATYRKFTVATVRFTQNVTCNIFTHPIYQQVANVTV